MTLPELSLAIAGAGMLLAVSLYCAFIGVRMDRPTWGKAPVLSITIWWMGQILVWAYLLLLAGGILGIGLRAGWKLL